MFLHKNRATWSVDWLFYYGKSLFYYVIWWSWRDLNPCAGSPTYSLSRRAPSASWVQLQMKAPLNLLLIWQYKCYLYNQLIRSCPSTHRINHLWLLRSRPDQVHGLSVARTPKVNTAFIRQTSHHHTAKKEFILAIAGCELQGTATSPIINGMYW
jgi:hypothetical protein